VKQTAHLCHLGSKREKKKSIQGSDIPFNCTLSFDQKTPNYSPLLKDLPPSKIVMAGDQAFNKWAFGDVYPNHKQQIQSLFTVSTFLAQNEISKSLTPSVEKIK
jgi:hypothetical protein